MFSVGARGLCLKRPMHVVASLIMRQQCLLIRITHTPDYLSIDHYPCLRAYAPCQQLALVIAALALSSRMQWHRDKHISLQPAIDPRLDHQLRHDLANAPAISAAHIGEAIQYRRGLRKR